MPAKRLQADMKAVIIGGSNSVMKKGWVSFLTANRPRLTLLNRSIGATNSAMGFYRLQSGPTLAPGDAVIWEYALNDENWIAAGRCTVAFALRYVELCILFARKHGASFIPLVLSAASLAEQGQTTPYLTGLRGLLAQYGLHPVVATDLYCKRFGTSRVTRHEYADRVHYDADSPVLKLVAKAVGGQIAAPVFPGKAVTSPSGTRLHQVRFLQSFTNTTEFSFANRLISATAHRPAEDAVGHASAGQGRWRVVGVIVLRSPEPSGLVFRLGAAQAIVPTVHAKLNYTKSTLGIALLDPDLHLDLGPKDVLDFINIVVGPDGQPLAEEDDLEADAEDDLPDADLARGRAPAVRGLVALQLERITSQTPAIQPQPVPAT